MIGFLLSEGAGDWDENDSHSLLSWLSDLIEWGRERSGDLYILGGNLGVLLDGNTMDIFSHLYADGQSDIQSQLGQ